MKSFDINSPANQVEFPAPREEFAEKTVTFAVANTGATPVRGRAVARALQSAKSGWLHIEGDVERDFAPQEVHQFSVRIRVPKGTDPGSYSFRLECVDPSNEDDYTEGPAVALKVEEQQSGGSFPWWIVVAAGVGALAIGAVLFFVLRSGGGEPGMPDLIGEVVSDARATLEGRGVSEITVVTRVTAPGDELPDGLSHPVAGGTVLETNPQPGRPLEEGDSTVLFVEQWRVPKLKGKSIAEAEEILKQQNLQFSRRPTVSTSRIAGLPFPVDPETVVSTQPGADSPVEMGQEILILVEAPSISLPNLQGKFIWDAENILDRLGLKKRITQSSHSDSRRWGKVKNQSPARLTRVAKGSTVTCNIWVQRRARTWLLAIPQRHLLQFQNTPAMRNNLTFSRSVLASPENRPSN